ncbi:MAG: fatty acid desaturase [Pseudomonadota bacterium]
MQNGALDHRAFLASLSAEERGALTERRDGPGLWHLAGHAGLIVILGSWIAFGGVLWWALLPIQGVLIAFLFTLQHECTHGTPFKTRWLNQAVGVAAGALLVQPFHWFKAFHMAHHRYTNDPERDPELQGDAKPETLAQMIWHLSTIGYWASKLRVLVSLSIGQVEHNFGGGATKARIIREARFLLAFYAGVAVFSIAVSPILLWAWLVPLALGFPVLRLYLLAEHDRCPPVANMFENSRTTLTNRLVRALAWNMPYHAEHHAFPAVPFHQLPQLHNGAKAHIQTVTPGYLAFTKDKLAEVCTARA